jgi:hypothetical protein
LFVALAQYRVAAGEDIRQLAQPRGAAIESVKIALSEPVGPYFTGQRFRAQVVAPQAGWMTCFYSSPDDGTISLYPLIPGRPTFVSARTPLQLPSANEAGAYPVVRLSEAGEHALYCAQTRVDISAKLPAPLRPGADGRQTTLASAQTAVRQAAGSDWIADGVAAFNVVQRR